MSFDCDDCIPKKCSKICFICLIMVYSIVNFLLFLGSYILLASSSLDFQDVLTNWRTNAITDIQIAENCPLGYQEALTYAWPGTKEGCWCGNIDQTRRTQSQIFCTACQGYCNTTQSQIGCRNILPTNPVTLSAWGEALGDENKICIKRSNENWEQVAPQSGANCPNGLKKCGSNPDNIFCTTQAQCPINNIQISTIAITEPTALASCLSDPNCFVISQDSLSIKVLKYKRSDTYDAPPLSQIRINEYGMCSNFARDNISPNRPQFVLLRTLRNNCLNPANPPWNPIDTIAESKLYDINGLSKTISNLTRYGYYSSPNEGDYYNWTLFSRNYIPWAASCRGKMTDLINYSDKIDSLLTYQLMVVIVALIALICLGVVLPCLLLQNLCCGNAICFKGSGKKERKRMKKFAKVWTFVFMAVQAPFQILAIINAMGAKNFLMDVITQNCSNAGTLAMLTDLAENLKTIFEYDLIAIIILVVIFLSSTGFFIYKDQKKKYKKDKKKKKKSSSDSDSSFEMHKIKKNKNDVHFEGGVVSQAGYYQAPHQYQYPPNQIQHHDPNQNHSPPHNMGYPNQGYQQPQHPQQYGVQYQQPYQPYAQPMMQQYPPQGQQQGIGYYQNPGQNQNY